MMAGYAAAIAVLVLVAGRVRLVAVAPLRPPLRARLRWCSGSLPMSCAAHAGLAGVQAHAHARFARRRTGRVKPVYPQRHTFSPLVEPLAW